MSRRINVLIFPAGEINSVELHDALSSCVNIRVTGASSVDRHGEYVFKDYVSGLPFISSEDFIDRFNELLISREIDIVFPTHDTVALYLSEHQSELKAQVAVADIETSRVCRDKKATYDLFQDSGFVPVVYQKMGDINEYPVFVKPRMGQGAVGARKVQESADLPVEGWADVVVTEYLPGDEYTIDCLTDGKGELKVIAPRFRKRLMAGVCVAGQTEILSDDIELIAREINARLQFRGLWFFQIKRDRKGDFKLLEISTRCGGGMCLTRARGWNLPLLSVYAVLGHDISVYPDSYKVVMDRSLISRYRISHEYSIVYIDFDDTIVMNDGTVNLTAVRFLYQCRNTERKVVLITRHTKDLAYTLNRFCLHRDLFDSIIHLNFNEKKSDYIKEPDAIFIDNAFQERAEVRSTCNIPVFDVSEIEVLLDWRF